MTVAKRKTSYEIWLDEEDIPVVGGYGVTDVRELALKPWRRTGGRGAYIDLKGMEGFTGMYVGEIPPGVTVDDLRGVRVATGVSDGEGRFRFDNLSDGPYRVTASLEGFQSTSVSAVVSGRTVAVTIDMPIALIASVDVRPTPTAASGSRCAIRVRVSIPLCCRVSLSPGSRPSPPAEAPALA